jgi:hypothetical protein
MYFISPTTWKGDGVTIVIDFNFKDDMSIDTICNINIIRKDTLPKGISSLILKADTVDYALKDVQVLIIDSERKTVRVTSTLSANDFLKAMMAHDMTVNIAMNNQHYRCKPSGAFVKLKKIFVADYSARGEVLGRKSGCIEASERVFVKKDEYSAAGKRYVANTVYVRKRTCSARRASGDWTT